MRVLGENTDIEEKTVGTEYPFGATIKNETETERGTPVVEEILGDVLMNIYKILQKGLVTPNGIQDNENNNFQLVEAIQKLPNLVTDVAQVLNKSGNTWSLNQNLSGYSVQNFILKAIVTESFVKGIDYKFKDNTGNEYDFTSPTGFNSGDLVLIVFNTAGVKAYSLNFKQLEQNNVFTVLGTPISYNTSNVMYYESDGVLITDTPSSVDIQAKIRFFATNSNLTVTSIYQENGNFVVIALDSINNIYKVFVLKENDLNVISEVTGVSLPFTESLYFYYSNGSFFTCDESLELKKYTLDFSASVYNLTATVTMDSVFENTTNTVINNSKVITLVSGELKKFNINNGAFLESIKLNTVAGNIFNFSGNMYFTSGQVAKLWQS